MAIKFYLIAFTVTVCLQLFCCQAENRLGELLRRQFGQCREGEPLPPRWCQTCECVNDQIDCRSVECPTDLPDLQCVDPQMPQDACCNADRSCINGNTCWFKGKKIKVGIQERTDHPKCFNLYRCPSDRNYAPDTEAVFSEIKCFNNQ